MYTDGNKWVEPGKQKNDVDCQCQGAGLLDVMLRNYGALQPTAGM